MELKADLKTRTKRLCKGALDKKNRFMIRTIEKGKIWEDVREYI